MFGWLFGTGEKKLGRDELPLKKDIERIKEASDPTWTYVFIPASFFESMSPGAIADWEDRSFDMQEGRVDYWADVSDRGDVACFEYRHHAERVISENPDGGFTIISG